jgi:SAM-dependent methyltransferase
MKINLGCGRNHLEGWKNYDADVDITKPLPFPNNSADCIFAEHVVEHVGYYEALGFFRECHRVLGAGGIVRIAVPSVERILRYGSPDYFKFASKWGPTPDVRGAMHAILHAHGHRAPWTESLLTTSLFFAGFDNVEVCTPGQSHHEALRGVEGHGRVIGEYFNWIETTVAEATKQES